MNLDFVSQLVASGQWAALALLVLTLFNHLLTTRSDFPITAPGWLRPLLTILAGQGLAVLAAYAGHQPWKVPAVHAALASIIAISTSHAIFTNGAPPWMQTIGMVAEEVEGVVPDAAKKPAPKGPPPIIGAMLGMFGVLALVVTFAGCPAAGPVVQPVANASACIAKGAIAGHSIAQIVIECAVTEEEAVLALINAIEPAVIGTPAHKAALHLKAALANPVAADGGK